jgi:3-oxosteroid 1-dehydrogenase
VSRFNADAAQGQDPDFQRGEATYDKLYGDARHGPNPCLRPIEKAPFYAMPIWPGDIGTNGGLATNAKAQVLDGKGKAIGGLYAIGNSAASAMGESYPGAGVTLGPALTFGYIAAREMTGANG